MKTLSLRRLLAHSIAASALLGSLACGQILGIEETTKQVASCSDKVKNGDESDVDCGGSCSAKCLDSKVCLAPADCASGVCTGGICYASSCVDLSKDGDETDVDCGGSCSTKCADNKACVSGADCISSVCSGSVCQAPSCSDKARNGSEPDVDCDGECPLKCDNQPCGAPSDCQSGICKDGACLAVWACLGNVPAPPAPPTKLNITVLTTSAADGSPLNDIKISACPSVLDQECSTNPITKTSIAGKEVLEVSTGGFGSKGFAGYLRIEGDGFQPLLWFFPSPLVADTEIPAQLLPKSVWDGVVGGVLAESVDRTERGDFVAQFLGCDLNPAPNVAFQISSQDEQSSPPLYFESPSFTANLSATNASGTVAMFNLPKGKATLNLFNSITNKTIQNSFEFFFRPGFNSTFVLPPR